MPGCCVPQCSNHSRNGWKLYRFPRDPKRRLLWTVKIKRDKWQPTDTSHVCSAHFEENNYEQHRADGWKKLKPNAAPTLFTFKRPVAVGRRPGRPPLSSSYEGRRLLRCSVCQYATPYPQCMEHHQRKHTGERPYKCDHCGKGFTLKWNMIRKWFKMRENLLVSCGAKHITLPVSWLSFYDLLLYTCVASLVPVAPLLDCGFREIVVALVPPWSAIPYFDDSLTVHRRRGRPSFASIHGRERLWKCPVCDYATPYAYAIKNHQRTHTGERPYKCDQCDKAFRHKHHLVEHVRAHTGEKPFQCPICPMKFVRNGSLKVHLHTHGK
ncbi:uncharacterized protein LOC142772261 [Rhipicephalus microplus]|uniref:uncharacterized protein LOC142772261 n=1 Tax=Rhipicephalus microplus TaxID=6941 RepID=UPI003F6C0ED5